MWEQIINKESCAECAHTRCLSCIVMDEEDGYWKWPSGESVGLAEERRWKKAVSLKRAKRDFEKKEYYDLKIPRKTQLEGRMRKGEP